MAVFHQFPKNWQRSESFAIELTGNIMRSEVCCRTRFWDQNNNNSHNRCCTSKVLVHTHLPQALEN